MIKPLRSTSIPTLLFFLLSFAIQAQEIYVIDQSDPSQLFLIDIRTDPCELEFIGELGFKATDIAVCAGGGAYATDGTSVYSLDLATGATALLGDMSIANDFITGLACKLDGFVYATGRAYYVLNPLADWRAIFLGALPSASLGDLAFYRYDAYYTGFPGMFSLNEFDTPTSYNVTPSIRPIEGLAAHYEDCHQMVGGTSDGFILILDASLGTVEETGCRLPTGIAGMGSLDDFGVAGNCDTVMIDLDVDNSNLTMNDQYQGDEINCGNISANVSDIDIEIRSTEAIQSAEINLLGFPPDLPDEFLFLDNANNIDIAGSGTTQIVLTDAGGATTEDFEEAIRNTVLRNTAPVPTPGIREVTVEIITDVGRVSNRPIAIFEVVSTEVSIQIPEGDGLVCEGDVYEISVQGVQNFDIEWSTSETVNNIEVDQAGMYSVTVTDPQTMCSDADTVSLETVPFTDIKFLGNDSVCFGETARIEVETEYNGPFTLFVGSDYSNNEIPYPSVEDGNTINIFPTESGFHFGTEVIITDGPSCFNLDSASSFVLVSPVYINEVTDTICQGDSVFLDGDWQTEEGVYEDEYLSQFGCDSNVQTTLTVLPVPRTQVSYGSCNPRDTGVFVEVYGAVNGCDSIVTRTVFYQISDTTYLQEQSCDPADAGLDTMFLSNRLGCDSLVITETELVEAVRTNLSETSCDPAMVGIDTIVLISSQNCDSLVITETTFLESDITRLSSITCDPDMTGIDTSFLSNTNGCDSLVIEETTLAPSDIVNLVETSCDPADTGRDTMFLTNQFGCDSLVITETRFLESDIVEIDALTCTPGEEGVDSVLLSNAAGCDSLVITTTELVDVITTDLFASSCNPSDTGVVEETYTSSQGCDSIVTTFTLLDPSDFLEITGVTCDPTQARDETLMLTNRYGCDSIVDILIQYIPLDTTSFEEIVCDPSNVGVDLEVFTSDQGCDSVVQTSFILGIDECMLQGEATADTIDCNRPTGSISVTMEEGEFPLNYTWAEQSGNPQGNGTVPGPDGNFEITGLPSGIYTIEVTDAVDATAMFTVEVTEILPVQSSASVLSDYNGSDVSCADASDGLARVDIINGGQEPFNISWSNGDLGNQADNLNAGTHFVTIVDARGCIAIDSVLLLEPAELLLDWMVNDQDCRTGFGSITDISADGGTAPYSFTLNNNPINGNMANNVTPGEYTLEVIDANDCRTAAMVRILEAVPPVVDLGPDVTVNLGDSVTINALVDGPANEIDSFIWSDGQCISCQERTFFFLSNTTVSVQVIRDDGCTDSDQLNITYIFDDDIYTPTAFSPNADGINDFWRVYEGGQIRIIEELRIYNRWGDLVFERSNVLPEDPVSHWDGFQNGKLLQPGVFVFHLKAIMNDGTERVLKGDILLTR